MAWSKVFEIPGLGLLASIFGAFPVKLDSVDYGAQREALELIKSGRALVIFPEGGRTINGDLMPFKMGAFRLALTIGAPIVPVAIAGGYSIWPLGKLLPRTGKVSITYLPPIPVERVPEDISKADLKRLARELSLTTHDRVQAALGGGKSIDSGGLPNLQQSEINVQGG